MSSKQRRANAPPTPVQHPVPSTASNRPIDMTLPQVLQLLETRIRKLEQVKPSTADTIGISTTTSLLENVISSLQVEYDSRFNLLVTEINQMKDIVMKLQSYTMDVNKTLLEERVHFMADLSDVKENIVMREKEDDEEEDA